MLKNMPWSSGEGNQKGQEKGEESLTSVLNDQNREEFTFLVASITAVMRKTIELNFDATVSSLPEPLTSYEAYLTYLGRHRPEVPRKTACI